jgi:hypothetical protein
MIFPDYTQTGVVYHVINLSDFHRVRQKGIEYDSKSTYCDRYEEFHRFINAFKTPTIPEWVDRTKAIFASMNFPEYHIWHSHSMLLAIEIDPARCWVANENRANQLYEPFILSKDREFGKAGRYLETNGRRLLNEYWQTSLSFLNNLDERRDKQPGYDAEVMIFHPISPQQIEYLAIVSDHRIMTIDQWKETFCKG